MMVGCLLTPMHSPSHHTLTLIILLFFSYAPIRTYLASNTISIIMRATLQIMRNAYENESEWIKSPQMGVQYGQYTYLCTKRPYRTRWLACEAKNAVVWPRGTSSSHTRIMSTLRLICVRLDFAVCAQDIISCVSLCEFTATSKWLWKHWLTSHHSWSPI